MRNAAARVVVERAELPVERQAVVERGALHDGPPVRLPGVEDELARVRVEDQRRRDRRRHARAARDAARARGRDGARPAAEALRVRRRLLADDVGAVADEELLVAAEELAPAHVGPELVVRARDGLAEHEDEARVGQERPDLPQGAGPHAVLRRRLEGHVRRPPLRLRQRERRVHRVVERVPLVAPAEEPQARARPVDHGVHLEHEPETRDRSDTGREKVKAAQASRLADEERRKREAAEATGLRRRALESALQRSDSIFPLPDIRALGCLGPDNEFRLRVALLVARRAGLVAAPHAPRPVLPLLRRLAELRHVVVPGGARRRRRRWSRAALD